MCIGFIKLHRKLRDWEWYTDVPTKTLFIHLLISVNHTDKNWRGKIIKRGQIITSLSTLSNQTGLSIRSIRTAIRKLASTQEVAHTTTKTYTMLELLNYGTYQDKKEKIDTKSVMRNDTQTTTTKEAKKIRKDIDRFDEFWDLYNYKKSKPKAEVAYKNALKSTTHENIIKGVKSYLKARGVDKQFWKHPTSWLNQGCWDDDYSLTKSAHSKSYKIINQEYSTKLSESEKESFSIAEIKSQLAKQRHCSFSDITMDDVRAYGH